MNKHVNSREDFESLQSVFILGSVPRERDVHTNLGAGMNELRFILVAIDIDCFLCKVSNLELRGHTGFVHCFIN